MEDIYNAAIQTVQQNEDAELINKQAKDTVNSKSKKT